MAVRLPSAALFGAALLALAAISAPGHAKPPDLPQADRPVCTPQCPQTAAPAAPTMPWSLIGVPEGGQEESEVRAAADRHAAARRMTRCLLLGTHPLLPFLPIRETIEDAVEEGMEGNPDDCDPLMVAPGTRLLFGVTQPSEKVLSPVIESMMRWLAEPQSAAPRDIPLILVNDPEIADDPGTPVTAGVQVEVEINPPVATTPVPQAPTCPYLQEQKAKQTTVQVETPMPVEGDVLGNLDKLSQAEDVYRQAEVYRAYGKLTKAKACYEKVHEMVPGSRQDVMATERLQEVRALMKLVSDQPAAVEEQEPKTAAPRLKKRTVKRRVPGPQEPAAAPPAPPAQDVTCPYLKEQAVMQAAPRVEVEMPGDVLSNLNKLEEAEKAIKTAEFFRRGGNYGSASFYYEVARKLCPGSRYDELAGVALKQMMSEMPGGQVGATEEQEEAPKPPVKPRPKAVRQPEPKPTPKEMIDKRLEAPISVNYTDVPLASVLDDFSAQGINIVLDYPALEAEGVNLYYPVTIKLEQVSVKSTLNLLLKQVGLVAKVQDDVIVVTTEKRGGGSVTVAYMVGDLIGKGQGTPIHCENGRCRAKGCSPESLLKFITSTVHPQSWSEMGGRGTIAYFPLGQSLVVKQSPDVQEMVLGVLESLRRLKDEQKDQPAADEEQSSGCEDGPSRADVEKRVHDLLDACQKAYLLGKYGEAEGLARKAMDVDVECVHRHPLVRNFELFLKVSRAVQAKKKEKPQAETPPVQMRQPDLPGPNQSVVPAMDQMLKDAGLDLEIVVPHAAEEQEPPAPPPSSEVKELFVEPPLAPEAEGCPCEAVKQFLQTVGASACAEVEGTVGCSRGRCELTLGCLSMRARWDRDGKGVVTLKINAERQPKPAKDPAEPCVWP